MSFSDPPLHGKPDGQPARSNWQTVALVAGPLAAALTGIVPPPPGFDGQAWLVVGLVLWMGFWWTSEAVPLPVTALLPLIFLPLAQVEPIGTVAANYAHPLFFLFLGGFMIAAAMQACGLHKRIALYIVGLSGARGDRVIGGFMLATAGLSMWISNTATTVMMYAVALSILKSSAESGERRALERFGVTLMLGIAYAASIGGVGTLIGTPPNAIFASIMEKNYGIEITFATWMMLAMPLVIIMLPTAWLILTRLARSDRGGDIGGVIEALQGERSALGPWKQKEKAVAILFVAAVMGWVFSKQIAESTGLPVTDTTVALVAASLLFIIPLSRRMDDFMLEWRAVKELPLGLLLVFGGGLALADAISTSGLAQVVGHALSGFDFGGRVLVVFFTIAVIIALTEFTSNTASAATFIPILAATAAGLGFDPIVLALPAALAASMAFMLPVATPPNTIVFAYEPLKIEDMIMCGFWLNLVALAACFLTVQFAIELVLPTHR